MFEKILIANRGDQLPTGGAAAESRKSYLTAESTHV